MASRPTGPKTRSSSTPSTRTTSPTSAGAARIRPSRLSTMPAARNHAPSAADSTAAVPASSPSPATAHPAPSAARTRPARTSPGVPASRSAAIGVIRPARRAGTYAASNVTAVPSSTPVTGTDQPMVRSSVLRFRPKARSATISPTASPMPAPKPSTEPISPSSSASISTERLICPRPEPIARSSPISRVRWATSIEKVLTMRNTPTSSAIPANPSSTYRTTDITSPMASRLSSAYSWAVRSWYVPSPPTAAATASRSASSVSEPSPSTYSSVNASSPPSRNSRAAGPSRYRRVAPGLVTV